MNIVGTARAIARRAHEHQTRRDGTTPYIFHVNAVASRLHKPTEEETATAFLHDVLEDSILEPEDLLAAGIPSVIVEAVSLLTHKKGEPYMDYLARLKLNSIARKVKIADMLSNLSDNPTDTQIVKYAKGLIFLLS